MPYLARLTVIDGTLALDDTIHVAEQSELIVGAGGRFKATSLGVAPDGLLRLATATSKVEVGTLNLSAGSDFVFENGTVSVGQNSPHGDQYSQPLGPLTISGSTASASPTLVLTNGADVDVFGGKGITDLRIGMNQRKGNLEITNSANFSNSGTANVGYQGGSIGTVSVDAGLWQSTGSINIGVEGTGSLIVSSGGQVYSDSNIVVGSGDDSSGVVTVIGTNSEIYTNHDLFVGSGGNATLSIGAGASIADNNGWIAFGNGSQGVVSVSGAGARWNNLYNLAVGGSTWEAGGVGTLEVSDGGYVDVGGTLTVWQGSRVDIQSGGTVTASNWDVHGTLINNGTLGGTTTANANSLLKGAGDFTTLIINDEGAFSPGNSPGTSSSATTVWNSGGTYRWEINKLDDGAGPPELGNILGWDLWNTGNLSINGPFTIELHSIGLASDDPTALAGWDSSLSHQWLIATSENGAFTPAHLKLLSVDSSPFADDAGNSLGTGRFSLLAQNGGRDLYLKFTPIVVPEPSTLALGILGAAVAFRYVRGSSDVKKRTCELPRKWGHSRFCESSRPFCRK